MKKPIALLNAGLMVFTLSFVSVGASSVQAEEQSSADTGKPRVRRSATMRPVIYKKLDGARELADAKKIQGSTGRTAVSGEAQT
jgi:hypothetical protein